MMTEMVAFTATTTKAMLERVANEQGYEMAVLDLTALYQYRFDVRSAFRAYCATDGRSWYECYKHLKRRGMMGLPWPKEPSDEA